MDGIAIALGFEELPDAARLHPLGDILFHFLGLVIELERERIAFMQCLREIAFEAEIAAVEHVGIDVGPNFGEMRQSARFAIKIRRGWNRNVGAYARTARFACRGARLLTDGGRLRGAAVGCDLDELLAAGWVHDFVHQA